MANYLSIVADGTEVARVGVSAKQQVMWQTERYEQNGGGFGQLVKRLQQMYSPHDLPESVQSALGASNVIEIRDDYRY